MSSSPFLSAISQAMRQKGYALKTEKTYLHWIKRFILFHEKRHPQNRGADEVRAFLLFHCSTLPGCVLMSAYVVLNFHDVPMSITGGGFYGDFIINGFA